MNEKEDSLINGLNILGLGYVIGDMRRTLCMIFPSFDCPIRKSIYFSAISFVFVLIDFPYRSVILINEMITSTM